MNKVKSQEKRTKSQELRVNVRMIECYNDWIGEWVFRKEFYEV